MFAVFTGNQHVGHKLLELIDPLRKAIVTGNGYRETLFIGNVPAEGLLPGEAATSSTERRGAEILGR